VQEQEMYRELLARMGRKRPAEDVLRKSDEER
jgi:hypothetical protein